MRLAEVTTTRELAALADEWNDLFVRSRHATPFQAPAWLIPWWQHVGEGALLGVTVREGARLVGVAPFYVHADREAGVRRLMPLGVATSDYLGAVFEPDLAERAATRVLEHLVDRRDAWDVAELPQLRADCPLLRARLPSRMAARRDPGEPCRVLPLAPRRGEWPATVPPRMRRNLSNDRNRAERLGRLSFEAADEHGWPVLYDQLIAQHGARWASRGEAGVLRDERVLRAHRTALPALLRLGVLRLYGMRLDGRLIATLYGLIDPPRPERRAYAYLHGFDPALAAVGPGTLIFGHAVREAMREGCAVLDFLRGGEPYKQHWGVREQATYVLAFDSRVPRELGAGRTAGRGERSEAAR